MPDTSSRTAASPRPSTRSKSAAAMGGRESYWTISMRPLHVLVFLLPLILAYEAASVAYLTNPSLGTRESIKAERLLMDFFDLFGAAGAYMPGVALVVVLLVWHFISADKWKVRWPYIGGMAAESVAWTLPLVVLGAAFTRFAASGAAAPVAAALGGGGGAVVGAGLADQTWQAKLAISVGAGLYEEMLFRLVGIAAVHAVFRDLLGAKEVAARVVAVLGTSIAFAFYHEVWLHDGALDWTRLTFLTLSGCYLGVVYILRGFGIVVATHALYDVVALLGGSTAVR